MSVRTERWTPAFRGNPVETKWAANAALMFYWIPDHAR